MYLTKLELKNIFERGFIPIAYSIPTDLVTENKIISNPISLLEMYIDLL